MDQEKNNNDLLELIFLSHFSKNISKGLKDYVHDEVLLSSRYLFVRRVGKTTIQYGFCTHCKKERVVKSEKLLKHNESWQCDGCKSLVQVKQDGRGRGKMVDTAYVIWYEKSLVDPTKIVATGSEVSRDYRENRAGVTKYVDLTRYLFEIGNFTSMSRDCHYTGMYGNNKLWWDDTWSFDKEAITLMNGHFRLEFSYQSFENIQTMVNATHFRYSTWERHANGKLDMIFFFAKFSKYPFIEYLNKMGMHGIVDSMVGPYDYNFKPIYDSIDLDGKTPFEILGLSKQEINIWKAEGVEMTPTILKTYKWFRENDIQITWSFAEKCQKLLIDTYQKGKLDFILNHCSLERIVRYTNNQIIKDKHFLSAIDVITSWKDYLVECKELSKNTTQEKVLFPNSLYLAHRGTTRLIKNKKDVLINKKIAKLVPALSKKYYFSHNGLLITPAISSVQMFDEGLALKHCVGQYASDYAAGTTVILLIRKVDHREEPYFTLELNNMTQDIRQCEGYERCKPNEEVSAFLEVYKEKVLNKIKLKASKNKPKSRQGVAV
jgi:hypothetical protein